MGTGCAGGPVEKLRVLPACVIGLPAFSLRCNSFISPAVLLQMVLNECE